MADSGLVKYESDGLVARITINRPEKRNSINSAVGAGLLDAFRRYAASDERCAIIAGAGDAAFCAGLDFNDPPAATWSIYPGYRYPIGKPMIAAVSGHCIGAGTVIAAHCDLIVATESAEFSFPEGQLGRLGGAASGLFTRVPPRIAAEMVMLGHPVSAEHAFHGGLVNRVVPRGKHLEVASEWAARIGSMAPLVMQGCKVFLDDVLGKNGYQQALPFLRALDDIQSSEDAQEGPAAWKARRAPVFRGR